MFKFKSFHFLLLILIIAAFFRLYNIAGLPPGLYPDEAMNGNNALEALSAAPPTGGFKIFYPENNGREGLFIDIQAVSVAIFGNEPWALRIVSAIFGIFTVLGVYFLTKELFSHENAKIKISLLASLFLAASFWHINFSRIGFRAIMAPFFLTWGVYFLLKSFNLISLNVKRYLLYAAVGGIFYGLGFHSYIAYRGTPLLIFVILVLYWLKNRDWESRKKILLSVSVFSLFALLVFAPLGFYFLKNPSDFMGRTAQVSVFSSPSPLNALTLNVLKTAGMFSISGDWNWRHNIAGKPLLFWPVGVFFIIGIIFGLSAFFKRNRAEATGQKQILISNIVLLGWLFVAVAPVVVSNEGIPHALRAILMMPPVFIFAGYGGILAYETISGKLKNPVLLKIFKISTAVFLVSVVVQGYISYFIVWGKNPNVQGAFTADYVKIGRELNAIPIEAAKYVIVEAGGADVRGVPMPSQTVMFITDTFTPEKQKAKNIHYISPAQISGIPAGAYATVLR